MTIAQDQLMSGNDVVVIVFLLSNLLFDSLKLAIACRKRSAKPFDFAIDLILFDLAFGNLEPSAVDQIRPPDGNAMSGGDPRFD